MVGIPTFLAPSQLATWVVPGTLRCCFCPTDLSAFYPLSPLWISLFGDAAVAFEVTEWYRGSDALLHFPSGAADLLELVGVPEEFTSKHLNSD